MIQKLSKHGDGLAPVIDPSILQQLGIDETTPLEVSVVGRTIVVSPTQDDERQKRFEAVMASANKRYAKTFRRLAEE